MVDRGLTRDKAADQRSKVDAIKFQISTNGTETKCTHRVQSLTGPAIGHAYRCLVCGELAVVETFEEERWRLVFEELKEIRSVLANIYDYLIMRDR